MRRLKPYINEIFNKTIVSSKLNTVLASENLQMDYIINGQSLVSIFTDALKDAKNPLFEDAPLVLNELKEEISLPSLRQSLLQDDPDFVATVAYVLGNLGDKEAGDYLIEVCRKYGM